MEILALTLPGGEKITAPGNAPTNIGLSQLLSFAVTTLIIIAILLTLFFLIYGGINMITSGGDKQKVVQARLKLTYAVVGLIIVFLSFFIVNFVGQLFGISLLTTSYVDSCANVIPGRPC